MAEQTTQLAAQLYTLREHTKTPADIRRTLEKLSSDGWRAVQGSALGPIETAELKKVLDGNGLAMAATHGSLKRFAEEAPAVIDEHRTLDCKYTAIGGYFPKPEDFTRDKWKQFAADFNAAASNFAGSGVSLGYHNHSHEWARVDESAGGQRAIDVLMADLDRSVWWEFDTYWVAHAGGDPAAWIDRVKGRIPCVHLKDMRIKPGREQFMSEVGEGNLDWPGILAACKSAGVEWYIVEQDHCYRDPFESLKISLENLKGMGLS